MSIARAVAVLVPLLGGGLSTGCLVLSLHPIYDPASIVFDEALIGTWLDAENTASVTIRRAEWNSYLIVYKDATENEELTGYLTELGRHRFVDVTPERGRDPGPFLVPVHAAYRITVEGDTLTVSGLNYDWFERAVRTKTLRNLSYAMDAKKNVLLTSDSRSLRAWVGRRPESAETFTPPVVFTRQK